MARIRVRWLDHPLGNRCAGGSSASRSHGASAARTACHVRRPSPRTTRRRGDVCAGALRLLPAGVGPRLDLDQPAHGEGGDRKGGAGRAVVTEALGVDLVDK